MKILKGISQSPFHKRFLSYLTSVAVDKRSDFEGKVGGFVLVGEGVAVGVFVPDEDPLSLLF